MYRVSVIIPVYNAEKSLRKCVESLVYGKEREIEIILIDDCSADNSWNVCEQLSKEHANVLCYRNEKNSGVSFTRNKGLKVVHAPYLMFVDSDDWVSYQYVDILLNNIMQKPEYLPVCGYTYIDYINETSTVYGNEKMNSTYVDLKESFTVLDKVLLQQLWNKIFCLDIILKYNIQFDESLSMGEDFKFVLDYMKVAEYKGFNLIKKELYYYTRTSNKSLMSSWSSQSIRTALEQYEQLYSVCKDDSDEMKKILEEHKKNLQYNFAYQVIRNKNYSRKERYAKLNALLTEQDVNEYYQQQKIVLFKEKTAGALRYLLKLLEKMGSRIFRIKIKHFITSVKKELKQNDITIISQNCIGGVFYHDMGMKFQSPTINLFFEEPDFLKYVSNLKYYNEKELQMSWKETYPIGYLEDVCIHFMHYDTCKEAKDTWERRRSRINYDKIVVLCTDRDGFDDKCFEMWRNLSYRKVLFTCKKQYSDTDETVFFDQYSHYTEIPDLISKREFYKDDILMNVINAL